MRKPTDKEVGAAMKFYAENGCYPRYTPPEVIELAKKLKAAASAMANPFKEENNA
jgi:hypothetical protein